MASEAVIFNIQTLTTRDGPGIRTLIFLKGCPLRCVWCSNPEGQVPYPQVLWHARLCTKCFSCVTKCWLSGVLVGENGPVFHHSLCKKCDVSPCISTCPVGALELAGKIWTSDELFDEIMKDVRLYRNSGGGVTFSGGEPLFYPEFVGEMVERLGEHAVNTCIETCGEWEWGKVEWALKHTDLIYYDIKTLDSHLHEQYTGKGNERILANLEKLASRHLKKIIVSIPMVPGLTDTSEKVEAVGKYLKGLGIERTRLIPYHRLGMEKYEALGMTYPPVSWKEWDRDIDRSETEKAIVALRKLGIRADIEGL